MTIKKRGLGKGLNQLLSGALQTVRTELNVDVENSTTYNFIELELMQPGQYQPRQNIPQADLDSLAESIKVQGVIQPIIVRKIDKKNKYEIIAGERRWRAAKIAGLKAIPVIINNVSNQAAMAIGLIENIQRQDLKPLEEATALERLAKEFGLTHVQVAEAVGKGRATVSNILRLLTLNNDVKISLDKGLIEIGHAKILLGLKGAQQSKVAKWVIDKQLSVRETELYMNHSQGKTSKSSIKAPLDPDVKRLQNSLSEKLGASLRILHSLKGRGKVVIKYNNLDELEGIIAHIH